MTEVNDSATPAPPDSQPVPPAEAARAEMRRQLLAQAEAVIDRWLDAGPPPADLEPALLAEFTGADVPLSPAPGCDLYTLWSGLTALTQEVKLQGRAFKQLQETLGPVASLEPAVQASLTAHAAALQECRRAGLALVDDRNDRQQEQLRTAVRRAQKELLLSLIDIRDRLARGWDIATAGGAADASVPAWRLTLAGAEIRRRLAAAPAIQDGYRLALARVNDILTQLEVTACGAVGDLFDPTRMRAVETVAAAGQPEGSIATVLRPGYLWNGELLRLAEVCIVKH